MNHKKTWFSYVLWLIAAGLSIYFSLMFMRNFCLYMGIDSGLTNGFMYSFPIVGILLAFLIRIASIHCKLPVVSKGVRYGIHVVLLFLLIGVFGVLRYQTLGRMDSIEAIENSAVYQAALIGNNSGIVLPAGIHNQLYSSLISVLLLFLGNKAIAIVYLQLFLQIISFASLCVIGYWLKKGVTGYIPALVFSISPLFYEALPEVTAANLSFCFCLLGILTCFPLCQKHDKKMLDYIWCCFNAIISGLLVVYHPVFLVFIIPVVFLLMEKRNVDIKDRIFLTFTYAGAGAFVYGICSVLGVADFSYFIASFTADNANHLSGMQYGSVAAFVVLTAFLWVYAISFWFCVSDHGHKYIISLAILAIMHFFGASYLDVKTELMLMQLCMAFLCMEGMEQIRIVRVSGCVAVDDLPFEGTDKKADTKKMDMEKTAVFENGVPSVTQIIGIKDADLMDLSGVENEPKLVDRTAPIENVLPMPKKHVPKVLDYAFEPEEEQMHYDIELENDEYDY